MRLLVGILFILMLSACGGSGIGRKGSIAWNATASESDKRKYFQGICLDKGYSLDTREMEVCISSEPKDPNARSYSSYRSRDDDRFNDLKRELDMQRDGQSFDCIMSGGIWNGYSCGKRIGM